MRIWRIFRAYTQSNLIHAFDNPGMIAIWMFEIIFLPLGSLFIWLTIAKTSPTIAANQQQIINYFLLMPIINNFSSAWHGTFFAQYIHTGELNKYLIRPIPIFLSSASNNLAEKLVKTIILLPMVFISLFVFPLRLSFDPIRLIYFFIALFSTTLLQFSLNSLYGVLGFWFDRVRSFVNFTSTAELTLGGRIIPIFLFSPAFKLVATILPFRYLTAFPVEIISGSLSSSEIFQGLVIQTLWLTICIASTTSLLKSGITKYSAYGS